MKRRQAIVLASALCVAPFLFASNQQNDPAPLEVTQSVKPGDSGDVLAMAAKNVSTKQIRGCVLRVDFVNATGKVASHVARLTVKSVKAAKPYVDPGEQFTWRDIAVTKDASGASTTPRITVDAVVFTDGTRWGPFATPESQRLISMTQGTDTAK